MSMPVLTLICSSAVTTATFPCGTLLSDALTAMGAAMTLPCGGTGRCGNCAVSVQGVLSAPDEAETALLRGRSLRLACRARMLGDCTVTLSGSAGYRVETGKDGLKTGSVSDALGAAVDIGTTTVAVALYDLSDGACVAKLGAANCQSLFGSDVLSRAGACRENPEALCRQQSMISAQLRRMIADCAQRVQRHFENVKRVAVAGNCIMEHLFAGLNPAGLTALPFQPKSLFRGEPLPPIPGFEATDLILFPCISGFVGGDTVAALLALGPDFRNGTALLADIGTNGEIVLAHDGRLTACATAAGPAFEGAGIRSGIGALPGALCRIDLQEGLPRISTIDGEAPIGLCGSGLVDAVAFGLETGLIDETGRLLPPEEAPDCPAAGMLTPEGLCFAPGVILTPGDVRAYQLAKAAVAAGMAVLPLHAGIDPAEIRSLTVAGGFGAALRPETARATGLIPPCLTAPVKPVGNAALRGAARLLLQPEMLSDALKIARETEVLELSADALFMDTYVDMMSFEDEI